MFTNLRELIMSMPDEKSCREYLAAQRWPDGKPVCPFCGFKNKIYVLDGGKKYKCGSKECYKKFSVTMGTVFEASNLPLAKWFTAVYLASSHKKGISSYQLGKDIGVSQKTAWFMLHRVREMFRSKDAFTLDNIVEIDETYIGGKVGNMSNKKRKEIKESGVLPKKAMVMGMIERAGKLKLISMANRAVDTMQPAVKENVDTTAVLITDSYTGYAGLETQYAAHETINHQNNEYVRDGVWHTNTIEGAFSQFKRSIYGIYHFCTPKHLSRYCDETMFRYNFRDMKDHARFTFSLQNVEGRLTYKKLVGVRPAEVITKDGQTVPASIPGMPIPIVQIKDGEVVKEYPSITEASRQTGLTKNMIWRVLKGQRRTSGGFMWKYL